MATLDELNFGINLIQAALKNINSVPCNLTRNPEVDKEIGEAYAKLQNALIKLNNESGMI